MDIIHIRNLIFSGKHGVYKSERRRKQKFKVDLALHLNLAQAGKTDSLSDTVDYHAMRETVRQIIEHTSSYLLEKIAQDIADAVLKEERIKSVTVTVQKMTIWKNGIPGVTITRS